MGKSAEARQRGVWWPGKRGSFPHKLTTEVADKPPPWHVDYPLWTPEEEAKGLARPTRNQQLFHFAFHLLQGADPWDAYIQANIHPGLEDLTEAEKSLHRLRAEDLAKDERITVLKRACQKDPRALLRGCLGMIALGLVDLALNGRSERTRLKAMTEIMNRGGLPVETTTVHQSASELAKLTDKELEQEILKLMV